MEKLFHVSSTANGVTYNKKTYDNVSIDWFVVNRAQPLIPYEITIDDYARLADDVRLQMENFVNEKFSLEEAQRLKDYLSLRNNVVKIQAIFLPIKEYRRGYQDIEATKGTGFYPLYKNQHYDLPFQVKGFFSVQFAEENIVGDERATVISKLSKQDLDKLKKLGKKNENKETVGDKTRLFIDKE